MIYEILTMLLAVTTFLGYGFYASEHSTVKELKKDLNNANKEIEKLQKIIAKR